MAFKCKLPWQGLMIHQNAITPCCNFTWIDKWPETIEEYINSPELRSTRESLSNGIAPPQCQKCVIQESISGHSYRTSSNKFENNNPLVEFEDISIIPSNTCNLKCTSCSGSGSFVRGRELVKMGLETVEIPHYVACPDIAALIDYPIKTLTIAGGEPFIDSTRDILDKLVKANKSNEIELRLNSNCTMITTEWLEYLNGNFKSTMIKASIDGVGAVNDYLRYPSNWSDIIENLSLIKQYTNITTPIVTSVLSNLSLIKFYQVIEWCIDNDIKDLITITATHPTYMIPSLLPRDLKRELLLTYTELREKHKDCSPRILHCIDTCIDACNTTFVPAVDFNQAIEWFLKHDQLRGNDLFEIFPELIPYAKT